MLKNYSVHPVIGLSDKILEEAVEGEMQVGAQLLQQLGHLKIKLNLDLLIFVQQNATSAQLGHLHQANLIEFNLNSIRFY